VLVEARARGSVAEVWVAKSGARQFAVKLVRPDREQLVPDAVSAVPRRFSTEARRSARLGHACLVRLLDRGTYRRRPFIVLELASYSIQEVLKRFGPLGVAHSARAVLRAASGLQYLHGRGLIHRGVKPSNILQCPRGFVLADLGILYGDDLRGEWRQAAVRSATGVKRGPAAYMAPELLEYPFHAAPHSDLYALGVTWHEMLSGRLPARQGPVPSLLGEVNDVILRLLEKDPTARPSVEEVIALCTGLTAL
jgi:serine/threonine protein kinase